MEYDFEEEKELVPVPVRRRETVRENETPEEMRELPDAETREIPRRWRVY